MEVMIDLKTAVIFFIIGFLAGAAFAAIKIASAHARKTTLM